MSRGPSSPERGSFVSGTDLTDEIRRHLRTLRIITRKGEGTSILGGQEVKITDVDPKVILQDLEAAQNELNTLSAEIKPGP